MRRSRSLWDYIDLITEAKAKELAAPHFSKLRACIEDGFRAVEEMEKAHTDFFHVYPSGARATIIFWQIVSRAEVAFTGVKDVRVSHNRRFLTVLIGDQLEIRFKKLNRQLRSSNYQTSAQKVYGLQLRLVGMEEPTRATAGYRLSDEGTLRDVSLVCRTGQQLEWAFPIPIDDERILAHPALDIPPAADRPKVRPKKA